MSSMCFSTAKEISFDGEAMSAIYRSVQSYTSTDNLRKQFVETCRWEAYKKDLVDSIIATKNKRKDGYSR